jgi:bifunctional non-homologous end joining protein LigD
MSRAPAKGGAKRKRAASSTEGLAEYNRRRDFSKTSEPAGGKLRRAGDMFVVQKHAATRLHYDFRLEHDGVLMSWAVPQGPSIDPAVKRLAVRTENHPLEYGSFEGVIPKGEYGAGAVIIWDTGKVKWVKDPDATMKQGKLEFILDGERLKGEFHMVRMKPRDGERSENWLLIKSRDVHAGHVDPVVRNTTSVKSGRTIDDIKANRGGSRVWSHGKERTQADAKPPKWKFVEPALCTLVEGSPAGKAWLHEIKYDGYRLMASVSGKRVRLYTRSGLDWTGKFTQIADALANLGLRDVLLDGEVAVADPKGRTDFSSLQKALEGGNAKGASYFVFDVLFAGERDLRKLPLTERKERLGKLLKGVRAPIRVSPVVHGNGPDVLEAFREKGLEGVVSKKADSPYRSGRSLSWLKAKCANEREFIIVGYQPSEKRAFSSLLLADRERGKLHYRGNVGTGFDEAMLKHLSEEMHRLARKTAPLEVPREAARGAKWVTPDLVAQVRYTELTRDGAVRHGVFLGLRGDKSGSEVRAETERPMIKTRMRLTHPDKVLFPDAGVTKAELAAYFEAAAERMGPHVFGRPVSLVRAPDGVGGQVFFQKHAMAGAPKEIETTPIKESGGKTEQYLTLPNTAALVACAQISALEVHLWGSRNDDLEKPDRMVFDLDPDEDLPFSHVKHAALDIKTLLDTADLPSFAMLTGGKGIHIVLHLKRRHDWDEVKTFAGDVANAIATLDPKRFVATMTKKQRHGRIFIDYFRNHRGSTAIAPYSPRARGTAPVAVPVSWKELKTIPSANTFKLKDMAERLAESDPWADYAKSAVTLTKAARSKLGI